MSESNVKLFFDGDQFFSAGLTAIRTSKKEVCLETYIFQMDQIGLSFLDEMSNAVKRGVKVHLLVDGVGSMQSLGPLRHFCSENHIHFRAYHPVPFFDRRLLRRFWSLFSLSTRFFRRMNSRNHRKTLIVDHTYVLVGSFNITQVHSARVFGDLAWRDTAVAVERSDTAQVLQDAFFRAWRRASLFRRSRLEAPLGKKFLNKLGQVRLNDRLRRRFHFARDLRRRIRTAHERILITNAYFLPRRSFISAVRRAARSGIYIAICLPAKSDVRIVRYASRTLYRRLIRSGVHIFEYQPTMLHAKTLVIDQWAAIGSHNLNHRSFMHDLEVELTFEEPEVLAGLEEQWKKDIAQSHEVTLDELAKDSIWRKMFSRLCFLFRYYL